MGDVEVRQKVMEVVRKWMMCMCIIAFLMATYCIVFRFFYGWNQVDVLNMRVQYADAVADAEAGEYDKLDIYECAIVGVDAKVIYTNSHQYKVGQSINLHTLSTGNSINGDVAVNHFISPLIGKNGQIGTLVVAASDMHKTWSMGAWFGLLLPFLFLAMIIYCTIRLCFYIKRDVVEPVNSMRYVAGEILKGNYEKSIDYDNENESGKLCQKSCRCRTVYWDYTD